MTNSNFNFDNWSHQYHHTSDGTRIFYSTNFKISEFNPVKMLLAFNYGLVCSNNHWIKQIPYFHEQGFQIITHDYRGHFNSSGSDKIESITFKNMAQDQVEILESLQAQNVVLLGHSMGVNTALELARKNPKYLKGMVLISGTVIPPQSVMFYSNIVEQITPLWVKLSQNYPKFYQKFWQFGGWIPWFTKAIRRGGFNENMVPLEFVEIYLNRMGQLKPEVFFQCFQEMHDHDVINDLDKINIPALVMGGDNDQVIPNHLQQILIDKLPKSEFYIIQDGSHVPQVDFADTVNERITLFIQSILNQEKKGPKQLPL
jgi:pimeloyl-ACP methyl ester carboxylesterase